MKPNISILVPVYREEENISTLYNEIYNSLINKYSNYEIIFIDDGSNDNSWNEVLKLNKKNKNIKGIKFTRNFGHQYALHAGMTYAQGQAVITLDADLQHPPSVIPQLLAKWKEGYKIINTQRTDNVRLSQFKKITSRIFYKLFSFLSGVRLEHGMADFRLLDREVVQELLKFNEFSLFIRGLVQWTGFSTYTIQFNANPRYSGKSKYNLTKMIKLALSAITSFSIIPLRLGIIVGIMTSFLAFLELLFVIGAKLFSYYVVPGWASAVGVISFLFGIMFILIGLLGEYIGQIFIQVQQRPKYILSETIGF